jgi:type I restriction enzyme S subunit
MKIGLKTFEECIEKASYRDKIQRTNYLTEGKFPIVSQESSLINGYWNQESEVINVEKPVIVFGDHTRVLKYIDFSFVLGADGTKIIKPKDFIETKFFYYFLQANPIKTKGYARHYRFLKKLSLYIPPLPTQQKIVSKLDLIFAKIDKVTATAEDNSKNSYSLYSSAADVIFNNLDNKYVKLSACADIGYGYTSRSSIEFSGPQYLRITDIQEDNVDWLLVPRIQGKVSEVKKFLLKDGDIVFARTGATTGKSYLIKNPPVSVFASYLIKVDADRNLVLPEYLRHLFRSEGYWNTINSGISGTAQGGFNASKLNELSFPLPDLDKQRKIVVELNRIEMLSITAKKSFDMKVNLLNSLKKSILKQAFNDELVKAV